MQWDESFKPTLRPVEAFRLEDDSEVGIGLRDRSRLSPAVLTISDGALHVLSFMDGNHSCADLQRLIRESIGQDVSTELLHSMLDSLSSAHFLEGASFDAFYETLLSDYRGVGLHKTHFESLGLGENPASAFDEMLGTVPRSDLSGTVVGLVAPHLDYPRGKPCYAAAYGALHGRSCPDRVVILGTNHFGRSSSVVATAVDFETPLGLTRNDVSLLEALERTCGSLRTFELDHANEHSIELQVAWLQHIFGVDTFQLAAFLCPDPCGPSGTAPYDGVGVDLRDFSEALRSFVKEDSQDTLFVAGADLSHIGAEFGDERRLDEDFLGEVDASDRAALTHYEAGAHDAFVADIAKTENATRVCSAGCMFALSVVLPKATRNVLRYHQAVDEQSQTGVTCCSVAFTSNEE